MRWVLVFGLYFILAQSACFQSCPGDECSTHKSANDTDYLKPGQSLTLIDTKCSTCGHASAVAHWQVQAGQTIEGSVVFTMQASCGSVVAVPYSVTVDPKVGSALNEPPNARNLCGEDAQETWTAVLLNASNTDLNVPSIDLTCPTYSSSGAGGSPLGPSGVAR
jgi:hypothetical protein